MEIRSAYRKRADVDLLNDVRRGNRQAFEALWERHYSAALVVARSQGLDEHDAQDAVSEAFVRIARLIARGGGPTGAFRPYLYSAVRNISHDIREGRRTLPLPDDADAVPDLVAESAEESAMRTSDAGATLSAFRSLPVRWQEVLWLTEVEGHKPAAIAPMLGMNAVAVARLAYRAREGLKKAWIAAHLRGLGSEPECRWVVERLAGYARGTTTERENDRIAAHLATCPRCIIVHDEADRVASMLALSLLPIVLGAGGAAAYLALSGGTGVTVAAGAAGSPAISPAASVPAAPAVTGLHAAHGLTHAVVGVHTALSHTSVAHLAAIGVVGIAAGAGAVVGATASVGPVATPFAPFGQSATAAPVDVAAPQFVGSAARIDDGRLFVELTFRVAPSSRVTLELDDVLFSGLAADDGEVTFRVAPTLSELVGESVVAVASTVEGQASPMLTATLSDLWS